MSAAEIYIYVLLSVGVTYVVGMSAALYLAIRFRLPLLGAPPPRPVPPFVVKAPS